MTEPDREKPGTERVTEVLRDAGEIARAGIGTARKKAGEALAVTREKAGDALAVTREKAGDALSATREKGEAVIEDTREKTMRAAAETNRLFQEHPIAAVAAAAAAGAVIGIFLPRLALGAKVGKLARGAAKAAVTTEAAQAVWSSVRDAAGKATAKSLTDRKPRLPAPSDDDKDNK